MDVMARRDHSRDVFKQKVAETKLRRQDSRAPNDFRATESNGEPHMRTVMLQSKRTGRQEARDFRERVTAARR